MMVVMENTPKNSRFVEELRDLCMDFELKFLSEDEFEAGLTALAEKYGGNR